MNDAILRSAQFSFVGRVGGDPEVKYFETGTVNCKFSIAINRGKKDDRLPPDWFKVELWGDEATAAGDAIKKGDLVKVTGRVSTDRWSKQDGTEQVDTIIKAEHWSHLPTAAKPVQQQPRQSLDQLPDLNGGDPF